MNITGKTDKQLRRMCVNSWKRRLKLSVKDIVVGKAAPVPENCAFCVMYIDGENACSLCPVRLKTGKSHCDDTPYEKADFLYQAIQDDGKRNIKDFHKAAQRVIDYLEALEC